jgi:hypothetical protein
MTLKRGATVLGALVLGVLPLTLASPAFADSHTATLTVGPVVLPAAPVEVCLDTTCTSTESLLNVTLKAEATTTSSVQPVVLTRTDCPAGTLGAGINLSSSVAASATVKVTATGTGTDGTVKTVVVGPQTVTVDQPGLVASACTTD